MLRCDKCGKIYPFQDQDVKEDITTICECGGHLVYFQDLADHIFDELDPFNELVVSSGYTILDKVKKKDKKKNDEDAP